VARLDGKIALVTGGASGIGAAAARMFSDAGARVVVADVDIVGARRVAGDCGDALALEVDLTEPVAVAGLIEEIVHSYSTLDLAFNNAGRSSLDAMTADYPIDGWHDLLAANLHSVYYCLKYELPVMVAQGGGAIVNTASIMSTVGGASCAYTASKHAVLGLTRQAAIEYAPLGVRINCIGPGYIGTPMTARHGDAFFETAARMHPIGRAGTAEEVARLALFLLSDAAAFCVGGFYPVDGGYTAR
jgi:NAD(P)-dependent dehydrogenase (short-subunit alcohol dehydrogenase family)